jgi:hypothetical protein
VIGADAVPERDIVTQVEYVPPRRYAVSPGWSVSSAFWTVRHGAETLPAAVSEPLGET